jgi:hypothetical protein
MFQYQAVQTGQITVTGTATLISAAYPSRSGIVLVNTGSTTVYIGENASVTALTGCPLLASTSLSFSTTGAVYGITAGGSDVVGFLQTN